MRMLAIEQTLTILGWNSEGNFRTAEEQTSEKTTCGYNCFLEWGANYSW